MPDPGLTAVTVTINFSDGVDPNSNFQIQFRSPLYNAPQGLFASLSNSGIGDGAYKEIPLLQAIDTEAGQALLKQSQVVGCSLYLQIDAVGRDHCGGSMTVEFVFDDGTAKFADCGSFGIGTFHESNTTNIAITSLVDTLVRRNVPPRTPPL